MDMLRITALWSGFNGAPGYSNFFFNTDGGFWDGGIIGDDLQATADGASERVSAAFNAMREYLPSGVEVRVHPEAEVIDSNTGEARGIIEVPEGYALGNGGSGGWSAASGAVVNWRTNDYRAGRRIRGRTFLVPLAGKAYEADGTLAGLARTAIQEFGTTMIGGTGTADFGVWSRPRGGSGGVWATVVASTVPDMAAVLRSRRD